MAMKVKKKTSVSRFGGSDIPAFRVNIDAYIEKTASISNHHLLDNSFSGKAGMYKCTLLPWVREIKLEGGRIIKWSRVLEYREWKATYYIKDPNGYPNKST